MSMLAIIQPASAPNPGSVWPGIKGQADKSEFQVKDHAPPGPEPPPPDHLAKGEEASSDKLNASSRKPDSLPEAKTTEERIEGQSNSTEPAVPPTEEDAIKAQEPDSAIPSPAAAFAAAILISNPAGLFSIESPAVGPGIAPSEIAPSPADLTIEGAAAVPVAGAVTIGQENGEAMTQQSSTQGHIELVSEFDTVAPAIDTRELALGDASASLGLEGTPQAPQTGDEAAASTAKASEGAHEGLADDAVLQKLRPVHVVSDGVGTAQAISNTEDAMPSSEAPEAASVAEPTTNAEPNGQAAGNEPDSEGTRSDGSPTGKPQQDLTEATLKVEHRAGLAAPEKGVALATEAAVVAPAGPRATNATSRTDEVALKPAEAGRALHQVADRIEMLAAIRPKDGVTVRLDPEHLGTITIKVMGSAKEITAELTASNDSVRTALREHAGELTQALSARGVQLQSVQVGSETAATLGGRHQGSSQTFDQSQTARFHHGFPREATTDGFTLEQARGFARRATGVDVWV